MVLGPRGIHLLAGLVLLAAAGACVPSMPVVRLAETRSLATLFIVDSAARPESSSVPQAVAEAVERELAARNLKARSSGEIPKGLPQSRDSNRRLASIPTEAGDAGVLLVELTPTFYSQIDGRYRWTVHARLTLRVAQESTLQRDASWPAVLQYEHEGAQEAVQGVATSLAREVGALLDSAFAGTVPQARGPIGESIYFVLVDRFANGDPANDGDADRNDQQAWHGGDLQGVIDRLDHLQSIGVDTVWISPVFASQDEPFFGVGAFHGYWTESLESLDERFGDTATLVALADALHTRGMRLVLDWVVNHAGYTSSLVRQHPDWFHGRGSIMDWHSAVELQTHDVHGLPDFAQEQAPVYAYLLGAARRWLALVPFDGLRMDAVKHVPLTFWSRYNADLLASAPNLALLGEHYDGAPPVLARVQEAARFTHMFDFPLAFALRDVFCDGASVGRIGAVLSDDRLYADPSRLVTFVDNHDMPRILSACGNDATRVRGALTALLALRGTPALMYGTEAGLAGKDEVAARGDMVFATNPLAERLAALLELRRHHAVLRSGVTRLVFFADDVLGALRLSDREAALVLINGADATRRPSLSLLLTSGLADALTGERLDRAPELAAHSTWVGLVDDVAALWTRFGPTPAREISVHTGPHDAVFGTGPELGHWQAPGVSAQQGVVRLRLPAGNLFAYKLVRRDNDGALTWEDRADRYLLVEDDASIHVAWGEG